MSLPAPYLIAVGERCNFPDASDEVIAEIAARWNVVSPWTNPAFPYGRSRDRLLLTLGREPDRFANLLSPSNVRGAWDATLARPIADAFLKYVGTTIAGVGDRPVCLALLGRKVNEAFGLRGAAFGTVTSFEGVRALTLPHPSGRNPWLEVPGNLEKARSWTARLLRGCGSSARREKTSSTSRSSTTRTRCRGTK